MTQWRKSSYSQPHGQCVELWRKSSHSSPNGNCVELIGTLDRVRDSKNPGPILTIDLTELLAAVKADRFTL